MGDSIIIHDDSANIPAHILNETLPEVDKSIHNFTSEHLAAMPERQPFITVTGPDLTNQILGTFNFFNKTSNSEQCNCCFDFQNREDSCIGNKSQGIHLQDGFTFLH